MDMGRWLKKVVTISWQASRYGTRVQELARRNTRNETVRLPNYNANWTQTRTFADAASSTGNAPKSGGKDSTGGGAASGRRPAITEEYKAAWKKVAPRFDVHKTPSDFMDDRPGPATAVPTKLTVNFVLPSRVEMAAKEVDMVIVPAATGMMGLLAGHVPTIAQLSPGLLTVHDGTEVKKYFVSSGFAIVHSNSVADITVVEAVTLDQLDIEEARKGLAEYTQKQNSATTEHAKAEAQIAMEVYGALVATMTSP
ncbi:unnamed protein product [Calypogeia fissa]